MPVSGTSIVYFSFVCYGEISFAFDISKPVLTAHAFKPVAGTSWRTACVAFPFGTQSNVLRMQTIQLSKTFHGVEANPTPFGKPKPRRSEDGIFGSKNPFTNKRWEGAFDGVLLDLFTVY
jgi:hypothetical protein